MKDILDNISETNIDYFNNDETTFKRKKPYNKLLSYADDIDDEAQKKFTTIKTNLGRAVMLREIYPGCLEATYNLYVYINMYGKDFSKEDHILLIKLYYELATIPDLEPQAVKSFLRILHLLLKKIELIPQDELELDWRPLYDLWERTMENRFARYGMYRQSRNMNAIMENAIHVMKNYFPLNATREILDELRPKLYVFDGKVINTTIKKAMLFLPELLPRQHLDKGHELWFIEFMEFWENFHDANNWEIDMMDLMSRIGSKNIGYINWEPYLPLMFNRILESFNLPVYYKKYAHSYKYKLGSMSMARWIVSTLGNGSKAQGYLDKFLKTVETFLHPTNNGSWALHLMKLVKDISQCFVARLHQERFKKKSWIPETPDSHKLTDGEIDDFVKSILPLALNSMFSKCIFVGMNACFTLKNLATVRPISVIPILMTKFGETYDSLTEPNRFTSLIFGLNAVSRQMSQGSRNVNTDYAFADGPSQIIQLLFVVLPGIDRNDTFKCLKVMDFIGIIATHCPFIDSSNTQAKLNDEDRLIAEVTSKFEDFTLQLLDSIFTLVELGSVDSVRQDNDTAVINEELAVEASTCYLFFSIFCQCSDNLFEMACYKVRDFVINKTHDSKSAGRLIFHLCKMLVKANSQIALPIFLSTFTQTIINLIDEIDDISEEYLDNRLLSMLLVLGGIVSAPGIYLLPYIDNLTTILDKCRSMKSRDGLKFIWSILRNCFNSLTNLSIKRVVRIDRDYKNSECCEIFDWGQAIAMKNMHAKWYVPSEKEISVAQQLFNKYMMPEIQIVEDFIADPKSVERQILHNKLQTIHEIIKGCEILLPVWNESPLILVSSVNGLTELKTKIGINGEITMPDGSNVRLYFVKLLTRFQKVILKSAEDDTKTIGTLVWLWQCVLLGPIRSYNQCFKKLSALEMKRKFNNEKLTHKDWNIEIVWERLLLQQEYRVMLQTYIITETHKHIILQLLELATSRYAKIRITAQSVLADITNVLPSNSGIDQILLSYILDILSKDTTEYHDAYKGVLYILLNKHHITLLMNHGWEILHKLWPAMILAKTSEKLSVINLEDALFNYLTNRLFTKQIELEIPLNCIDAAENLFNSTNFDNSKRPSKEEIENGRLILARKGKENLEYYNSLQDNLIEIVIEKNLHWRRRFEAMQLIVALAHSQGKYSSKIVKYFLQGMIHDAISEREIAMKVIVNSLIQQRLEYVKIDLNLSNLTKIENNEKITFGERMDNSWLQYNSKTRPSNTNEWNETRYVDLAHIGYYVWPKKIEVDAPYNQQPTLDIKQRKFNSVEQEIYNFFINSQNIEKLINYLSLEKKKGKEHFTNTNYYLFRYLFKNYGDLFFANLLPHLKKLVNDKQECSQRCASEIIAGIIRGTKHWPYEMVMNIANELCPIIKITMNNLTTESISIWSRAYAYAQYNMDPNRNYWLMECLMDELAFVQSDPSLVQCGKISIVQSVFRQVYWRYSEVLHRLLNFVEDCLFNHPFQMLRMYLGQLLSTIFTIDLQFEINSIQTRPKTQILIDKLVPKLQMLAENANLIDEKKSLVSGVANVCLNENNEEDKERKAAIKIFKIICDWMRNNALPTKLNMHPGFYEFFLTLCQLENCDSDDELVSLCSSTLSSLARISIKQRDVSKMLPQILKASRNTSWWVKASTLDFLEVFVFHNMSILLSQNEWIEIIKETVLRLLEDERVEVREKSSQVLGGLLHCAFIPDKETLLEEFKVKARTRIRKRTNKIAQGADERANTEEINAIVKRHAGILGLCAFIQAHPYDIPSYVPSIFEHLGSHLHDPEPIPATIKKTMGNFKRTHYDGWSEHAQQFTEKQLEVLQDLIVPPPHYT
ncbi:proteasome activator complex subunit 4-like [Leptopilina boulardi]|uniref:proteasome activator complex subunit 4-like n=1 Tax=Leptopilina boulardi TaxID=63433 RepID=UPI0021F55380|nr:proteasome activator complex subunit 4-like [Leptopilina boulardi]XP_051160945.1 proteasome activator complex subunit 4-like [Leptopilina boulardi]